MAVAPVARIGLRSGHRGESGPCAAAKGAGIAARARAPDGWDLPGARYAWVGKKSGEGAMLITGATPQRIDIDFLKPFKANNKAVFRFDAEGSSTRVTWTMSGTRNALLARMGKLFFDERIGKDFDKGLAKLKAVAEA